MTQLQQELLRIEHNLLALKQGERELRTRYPTRKDLRQLARRRMQDERRRLERHRREVKATLATEKRVASRAFAERDWLKKPASIAGIATATILATISLISFIS